MKQITYFKVLNHFKKRIFDGDQFDQIVNVLPQMKIDLYENDNIISI